MKISKGRLAAAAAVAYLAAVAPQAGLAGDAAAPFGDRVSPAISYYNRASPVIGSAGLLGAGGVAEAKALGFRLILDLRAPAEGTAEEAAEAARVGIPYRTIPVPTDAPVAAQVEAFAAVIEDAANLPVLVHCETANRVGAMWALYRAARDVPPEIALKEGQTLGLRGRREAAVREMLGLPAPDGAAGQ
jgi:uncharacterized protein (TIGR01244 family)